MPKLNRNKSWAIRKYFWDVSAVFITGLCILLQASSGYAQDIPMPDQLVQADKAKAAAKAPHGSWLPVPIFITEPAIGYGLGAALAYFHPEKKSADASDATPSDSTAKGSDAKKLPPNITGGAAAYTDKGTWFAAVGHSHHWRNDSIRYTGGLAYADVYSDIYAKNTPIGFNLVGTGFFQQVGFRLGESNFFLGSKLLWLQTKSAFDVTIKDTNLSFEDIESSNVGLSLIASYDSRDNTFTPNKGQDLELAIWRYDESLGGDYEYWNTTFKALSFHQLNPGLVLGLRLQTAAVSGRAPFYAYPWVSLRGIPAMRYQGQQAGEIAAELRWDFSSRWAVVGFGGLGAVGPNDDPKTRIDQDIYSVGMGVRYFLMREMGLWLGIDVARGPDEWYPYITIGQAWDR